MKTFPVHPSQLALLNLPGQQPDTWNGNDELPPHLRILRGPCRTHGAAGATLPVKQNDLPPQNLPSQQPGTRNGNAEIPPSKSTLSPCLVLPAIAGRNGKQHMPLVRLVEVHALSPVQLHIHIVPSALPRSHCQAHALPPTVLWHAGCIVADGDIC